MHFIKEGKLVSEFRNNGKKSHSSDVEFDVVATLLDGPGGDRPHKEQEAEDDNDFWKNPVNQTTKIPDNEEAVKERKQYGGHIKYEEVDRFGNH